MFRKVAVLQGKQTQVLDYRSRPSEKTWQLGWKGNGQISTSRVINRITKLSVQREEKEKAESGSVGRQDRNGGTDVQVSKTFCRSQLCSSRDDVLWGKAGRLGLRLCQKEEGPEWRIDV